ncbi:MAG: hypothetical protein K0S11_15 [Gammaproteobacteria bacterium]|jgi:hypothetical protein|nr:hypothetical protein [Gammaproteobacteria bacterium]
MNEQKPVISDELSADICESSIIIVTPPNRQTDRLKNRQTINPLLEKMYGNEL